MSKLSVALAVFNEEKNIERCLKSIQDIADEIIIVDGGSTDHTIKIAQKFPVKIISTSNPKIFHINKQKALEASKFDWILQLDSDEMVSPELSQEIKKIINMSTDQIKSRVMNPQKNRLFERHSQLIEKRVQNNDNLENQEINAFYVPRKNYFLGGIITHAGTYPDGVIRLVRKGFAHFPAKSVHEQIEINGATAWLENDLLHYSNPNLTKYFTGLKRYTDISADDLYNNQIKPNIILFCEYCFIKPILLFINLYFRHLGFLDGWRGFLFSLFSSWHYPVIYLKLTRKY
jgi:glycosyltransferase involved in cell wall biosynthesis